MRPPALPALSFFVLLALGIGLGAGLAPDADQVEWTLAGTFLGCLCGASVAASLKVVRAWERMLVLRLGRFRIAAEPGLHFILPIIDTPLWVDMRVQTVDIAKQQTITQDNVPVLVKGVIFFNVERPEVAALEVQDYREAVSRFAQATLRDVVGRLSLDELLSHQERLETEIARNVATATKGWGLAVHAIKLEDIDVPEDLKKMMARQASSEREKRATIIKADGDRQAASALAEAAATMARSPGAMQLRTLQTLDGLGPTASNTVVLAVPIEILEALRASAQRSQA